MVRIRLARGGSKKRPFYTIVVADQRRATTSRFIERLGFYNPVARGNEEKLRLDIERVNHWVGLGAQPTERVEHLLKQAQASAPVAEQAASAPIPEQTTEQVAIAETAQATAAEETEQATEQA